MNHSFVGDAFLEDKFWSKKSRSSMSPAPIIQGAPSDLCELNKVSSKSIINNIYNIFPKGLYNIGLKYEITNK